MTKIAAFIAFAFVFFYVVRHNDPASPIDFDSCREQAGNAASLEVARHGDQLIDANGDALKAFFKVETDKCMKERGYPYMGSTDAKCADFRAAECYRRTWGTF